MPSTHYITYMDRGFMESLWIMMEERVIVFDCRPFAPPPTQTESVYASWGARRGGELCCREVFFGRAPHLNECVAVFQQGLRLRLRRPPPASPTTTAAAAAALFASSFTTTHVTAQLWVLISMPGFSLLGWRGGETRSPHKSRRVQRKATPTDTIPQWRRPPTSQ